MISGLIKGDVHGAYTKISVASPHLNAEKTHFQSIEMKHNTLLYDAIPPTYFFFTISIATSEFVFTIYGI